MSVGLQESLSVDGLNLGCMRCKFRQLKFYSKEMEVQGHILALMISCMKSIFSRDATFPSF